MNLALRAARVFAWRTGGYERGERVQFYGGLTWTRDGTSWIHLPEAIFLTLSPVGAQQWISLRTNVVQSAADLVGANADEPIAHDLLREAWRQGRGNGRSALVLAIAAAEIGFKQFAAQVVPEARWLLEELQAPPLWRMLRDFLPRLPCKENVRGRVFLPRKGVINVLKDAAEIRNRVVHGKAFEVDEKLKESVLFATRDLLYLLDYYSGSTWALRHVSPESMREMIEMSAAEDASGAE